MQAVINIFYMIICQEIWKIFHTGHWAPSHHLDPSDVKCCPITAMPGGTILTGLTVYPRVKLIYVSLAAGQLPCTVY